jgi:hypothetical protein
MSGLNAYASWLFQQPYTFLLPYNTASPISNKVPLPMGAPAPTRVFEPMVHCHCWDEVVLAAAWLKQTL